MSQTGAHLEAKLGSPPWEESGRSIVAAVDGSERNRAAIEWAATTAGLRGRGIVLLHVVDERRLPTPFHGLETDDQQAWELLDAVQSEVRGRFPELGVGTEVESGSVATTLVDRSAVEAELVVGRRGSGGFGRLLIGSTSLDVASRSDVPVVVVPDSWSPSDSRSRPVVVGVDRRSDHGWVLHYAFTQARALAVPLIAAHGREVPDLGWDLPATRGEAATSARRPEPLAGVDALVERCRADFPDVDVSVVDLSGHPVEVLLDRAGPGQLLVLGRRRDGRRGGFAFGSVAHGVLHYAGVPVAIVPPVD
jgi:nucleotide-binding universal stress UspA family protein